MKEPYYVYSTAGMKRDVTVMRETVMKELASVLLLSSMVLGFSGCATVPQGGSERQERDVSLHENVPTSAVEKQDIDPEKAAWSKVDQMEPSAIQAFLNQFPDGMYAKDARLDLALHARIQDIRDGKLTPTWMVPFEALGGRWKGWEKSYPMKGAAGVYRTESTAGIFGALGCGVRIDNSGMVVVPTGDGSILAIQTDGLPYLYVGDIIFQTEKGQTMYFGVIKAKGFVHIRGKGKVTTPDGKETLLQ